MKLDKALTYTALIIAGLVAVIFLMDLIIQLPFGRFNLMTDIFVIISAGLIIWQGIETLRELK